MSNLFEVDIKGFRQTLVDDAPRILCEPISNAFDTEATEVTVSFSWTNGQATYFVKDNDLEGFTNLADAWTLFAPSTRSGDAHKRGRFGYGEKEFIAICYPGEVEIRSTMGTVYFKGNERTRSGKKMTSGSTVMARFRLTKAEADAFADRLASILVPEGLNFSLMVDIPGHRLAAPAEARKPLKTVTATLATVNVDDDGNLRPTRRSTTVDIVEVLPHETPTIYELGMPVVAHDGRFHVNVHQKVPLNKDRDNVPPAYLRSLRELVLNNTYEFLSVTDAKSAWVTEALPKASSEALQTVVHAIHGKNAVIADPSNPEATKKAVEEGRVVVHGRQFTPETWKAIKANNIMRPAGQVIATNPVSSPDGKPPIPVDKWTPRMHQLAAYAKAVSLHLIGREGDVEFQSLALVPQNNGASRRIPAWYGSSHTLTINLGVLGKHWPDKVSQEDLDSLLIHEFSHSRASDHYSEDFHETCCAFGAKLRSFKTTWPGAALD
jgi:hypothetical protein